MIEIQISTKRHYDLPKYARTVYDLIFECKFKEAEDFVIASNTRISKKQKSKEHLISDFLYYYPFPLAHEEETFEGFYKKVKPITYVDGNNKDRDILTLEYPLHLDWEKKFCLQFMHQLEILSTYPYYKGKINIKFVNCGLIPRIGSFHIRNIQKVFGDNDYYIELKPPYSDDKLGTLDFLSDILTKETKIITSLHDNNYSFWETDFEKIKAPIEFYCMLDMNNGDNPLHFYNMNNRTWNENSPNLSAHLLTRKFPINETVIQSV